MILRNILLLGGGLFVSAAAALAHQDPRIQDNSFLLEEAYNQERGFVQHISTFTRIWNSRDWAYTFTQEWPVPRDPRHQFSYTLIGMHAGSFHGTGAGLGDVAFNYRYQIAGNGQARFSFAPRLSVLFPTGDPSKGRGFGGLGVQTNLPVSIVFHRKLVGHLNAGVTFVPRARDASGNRAATAGYNFGHSLVFLAHPRFNVLVETLASRFQSVLGPGATGWSSAAYVSPGIRWAYNVKHGLQIVPGVAVPLGIGPSGGDRGLFVYLSFEHPVGFLHPDPH